MNDLMNAMLLVVTILFFCIFQTSLTNEYMFKNSSCIVLEFF